MSGLGGGATTAGAGGKAEHGGSVEGGEITAHQVQAGGEERVHAVERGLAQVKAIVHRVLEGAQIDGPDHLRLQAGWGSDKWGEDVSGAEGFRMPRMHAARQYQQPCLWESQGQKYNSASTLYKGHARDWTVSGSKQEKVFIRPEEQTAKGLYSGGQTVSGSPLLDKHCR